MSNSASAWRIVQAYVRARYGRGASAAAIARAQCRGLRAHSGLGPRVASAASLQDMLDRLPLTDAATLRRNFSLSNRLGLTLDAARALAHAELAGTSHAPRGLSFGLSTGTDGDPGVFITTPAERASYIGAMLGKLLAPSEIAGCRVALLLKRDNRLYSDTSRTRLLQIAYFDIAAPLSGWIDRLTGFAPDVVIGPPSVLLAVAASAAFAKTPLRPCLLITGAEPTFPSDARRLELAYGGRPRPIYQACEGFIALGCACGRLHVNEDTLAVEWQQLRGHIEHAAPVVTDFSRTTQDVWRTRLPDVVRHATGACPCGSPLRAVAGVEGRFGDVLYAAPAATTGALSDGDTRLVLPFALDAAVGEHLPDDSDWRIEQIGAACLRVASQCVLGRREQAALRDVLVHVGGWTDVVFAPLQPRPPEVKRRRFVRLIDPASQAIEAALPPPRLLQDAQAR